MGGPGTFMGPNSREPIHFCEKNTRFVVYNGGAEGGPMEGPSKGGAMGGPFFGNMGGHGGALESTKTRFIASKISFF